MQFLLLVYMNENAWRELPEPEKARMLDDCQAYGREITASQHLLAGAPLVHSSNAVTIRTSNGQAVYTDGPFAETKEQLGGFLAIDVRDLNDAVRIAAHFPAARIGSIEVRPMKELGCAE